MDNITIAWNFFMGKGVSPAATAAILGTLIKETTTVNPNAINRGDGQDGSDSIGIMQWNSGRAANLRSRPNWQTLEVQLEFAWEEMNTRDVHLRMTGFDSRGNPLGMTNIVNKGARPLLGGFEEFIIGTDIDNLARMFDAAYTRSGDSITNGLIQRRVQFAINAFNRFNVNTVPEITDVQPPISDPSLKLGDMVRINPGSKWMTNPERDVPTWAIAGTYRIDRLDGDRAVIDQGGLNSPINIKDLTLA